MGRSRSVRGELVSYNLDVTDRVSLDWLERRVTSYESWPLNPR
jgi:hypothetical protein